MKNLHIIFIVLLSFIFFGCSSKTFVGESQTDQYGNPTIKNYESAQDYNHAINFPPSHPVEPLEVKTSLLLHYQDWKDTKYEYGGTTRDGVDCSAFVQSTFKSRFNISIPRTTLLQVKKGQKVSRKNLQAGDLIFFKTGKDQRHVGIYLSKGNFMHSSTKKGVTISSLNSPYYSSHFWMAKRFNF
ncbi:MAG: NlpC/P60 family protein [Campylobacterota bacterium]|nr:NlpC/P60 family protein [Campylobacterota bacterium]